MANPTHNDLPTLYSGDILVIKVKTNAKHQSLSWNPRDEKVYASLLSEPKEGKGNEELQKLFHEKTKRRIRIVSGWKAKEKRVEVF